MLTDAESELAELNKLDARNPSPYGVIRFEQGMRGMSGQIRCLGISRGGPEKLDLRMTVLLLS
jgi:hypothetical protein